VVAFKKKLLQSRLEACFGTRFSEWKKQVAFAEVMAVRDRRFAARTRVERASSARCAGDW
jgi:hypothetical protein